MSTDELFPPDVGAKLSPRLLWLREHNLETVQLRQPDDMAESPETGEDIPVWVCRRKLPDGFMTTPITKWSRNSIGSGDTENEAICAFCEASGITHWSGIP